MPYSFSRLFEELTGRTFKNRPIFEPPKLTPLRRLIAESTVGIFTSCGAQLPQDPKLGETEDISFRLISRDTPTGRIPRFPWWDPYNASPIWSSRPFQPSSKFS